MQTLQAITTRRSVARTVGPAPTRPEIQAPLDAAVLAPTHHLTQWRGDAAPTTPDHIIGGDRDAAPAA